MADIVEIFPRDGGLTQINRAARETALGLAAEIHDDFDEIFKVRLPVKCFTDMRRHHSQKQVEIVRDFAAGQSALLVSD